MRHAGTAALDGIEPLLKRARALPGVRERKRGIFYRGGAALLHFHEDAAGLFADLKLNGGWKRFDVTAAVRRRAFEKRLK